MSRFGKRRNRKSKKTINYTIDDFVDEEVDKFGKEIEAAMEEAMVDGKRGVMIVGTERVFVSDLVPYGKVYRAGSMEAVERLQRIKDGAAERLREIQEGTKE